MRILLCLCFGFNVRFALWFLAHLTFLLGYSWLVAHAWYFRFSIKFLRYTVRISFNVLWLLHNLRIPHFCIIRCQTLRCWVRHDWVRSISRNILLLAHSDSQIDTWILLRYGHLWLSVSVNRLFRNLRFELCIKRIIHLNHIFIDLLILFIVLLKFLICFFNLKNFFSHTWFKACCITCCHYWIFIGVALWKVALGGNLAAIFSLTILEIIKSDFREWLTFLHEILILSCDCIFTVFNKFFNTSSMLIWIMVFGIKWTFKYSRFGFTILDIEKVFRIILIV